jgi:hypothetical protein
VWQHVILVIAIAAALATPVVARAFRRRFDVFEPIVVFAVAYGVMFVSRPAWMVAHDKLVWNGPRSVTDVSSGFTKMLVLALAGAVAFVLAYESPVGPRLAAGRRDLGGLSGRRVVAIPLAAGAVAIASFIAFLISESSSAPVSMILRGRTTRLWQDVTSAPLYVWDLFLLLIPAALVLVAVGIERRNRTLVLTGVGFGALYLLRAVPLGDRSAILPLLGGAFVLYYLRRGRRPSVVALVLVAVFALLASAFLSDLRGRSTRGENVAQTIVRSTRPERIVSPLVSGPDSEMAPVLAAALSVIPSRLDYTYGRTIFGDLVTRPVPRKLWTDKPRPPRDKLIAALWPRERASINPEFSVLLYFFWDFGIAGVVAGMALLGIAARGLYEYWLAHHGSAAVQVVYALALSFLVIGLRNSPVDALVEFVFVVVPAWYALRRSVSRRVRVLAPVSR